MTIHFGQFHAETIDVPADIQELEPRIAPGVVSPCQSDAGFLD